MSLIARIKNILKNKLTTWITENIPLNYRRYGSSGIDRGCDVKADNASCKIYTLFDEESIIQIPEKLFFRTNKHMKRDDYLEDIHAISTHNHYHAWSLRNGRVYTNKSTQFFLLIEMGKIISPASFHHQDAAEGKNIQDIKLKAKFFPKPQAFNGRVVNLILGGGPAVNIFHWMIDALPRLKLIEKIHSLDEIDAFLVQGSDGGFRSRSLTLLGIDKKKIHFIDKQLIHIKADQLLATSHPRGLYNNITPRWIVDFHRERYLKNLPTAHKIYPQKVYISRKDSGYRGVENEEEVIDFLKGYGYESIVLSDYEYDEKISLFHHAKEIITMSGAGLAFLMYCKPDTKIVELFPDGFVHYSNYVLAKHTGLDYHYIIFGSVGSNEKPRSAQRQALTVNIQSIKDILS